VQSLQRSGSEYDVRGPTLDEEERSPATVGLGKLIAVAAASERGVDDRSVSKPGESAEFGIGALGELVCMSVRRDMIGRCDSEQFLVNHIRT
jgi:hypothetical protein